jgi:hypothetical protein
MRLFFPFVLGLSAVGTAAFGNLCASSVGELVLPAKVVSLGAGASSLDVFADDEVVVGLWDGRRLRVGFDGKVREDVSVGPGPVLVGYVGNELVTTTADRRVVSSDRGTYRTSRAAIALAPGEARIAVASSNRIELVDSKTLRRVRSLPVPKQWWLGGRFTVTALALSTKQDKLAAAFFRSGAVRLVLYETRTGDVHYAGEIAHDNLLSDVPGKEGFDIEAPSITKLAFSDDGETILAAFRSRRDSKANRWLGEVYSIPVRHPEKAQSIVTVSDPVAQVDARDVLDLGVNTAAFPEAKGRLIVAKSGAMGTPYSPVGKPWVVRGRMPEAVIYRQKGDDWVPALRLVGHDESVDFARLVGDRAITVGRDNHLVLWDVAEALERELPLGLFFGGVPFGITTEWNGGIPFPRNYFFAEPPMLVWTSYGRSIQGRIVDESIGPFLDGP